jgi:hypothetical protein
MLFAVNYTDLVYPENYTDSGRQHGLSPNAGIVLLSQYLINLTILFILIGLSQFAGKSPMVKNVHGILKSVLYIIIEGGTFILVIQASYGN